jgi:MFS family permease
MKSDTFNAPPSSDLTKHFRFNVFAGVLDGGFFGFALGFASFFTVVPLFVNTLTSSAILIGLIPALHIIGWQLPQLFTAGYVSRLKHYKPMVLLMTLQERVPFLALAVLAWFSHSLNPTLVLVLVFILLAVRGLGGGLTATAWQSMIAKIIAPRHRGKFFGLQSAAANLFASAGALGAGIVLVRVESPANFALCFFIASVSMGISWFFLSLVRESNHTVQTTSAHTSSILKQAGHVLGRDKNFSWFVIARTFSQFATMASAFYTIYAVRMFNMSAETAGVMTSVLFITQVIANPIMGALGDRVGHRSILILGTLSALSAALLAWIAPALEWFFLVFILTGITGVALWTTSIAMTLEFGTENDRPVYVGLANTLIAPATIAAPIIGGAVADTFGFGMTFLFSSVCAAIATAILHFYMHDVHSTRRLVSLK